MDGEPSKHNLKFYSYITVYFFAGYNFQKENYK